MAAIIRTSLLMFLVLLQSVAPLVHAHTGDGLPRSGGAGKLHVPGLENYVAADSGKPSYIAVSATSVDGLVVGINTGIRQDFDADFYAADNGYLPPSTVPPHTPTPLLLSGDTLSPASLVLGHTQVSAHTPRAPPAQNVF